MTTPPPVLLLLEDIVETAKVCAGKFDHYILKRDDHARGRGQDEVPRMLEQTLLECGVSPERLEVISSEAEAVNASLAMAEAGDLLLIFGDEISRCWKQITDFKSGQKQSKSVKAATNAPASNGIGAMEMQVQTDFGDQVLIRDERGVRLAREVETSD